MNSAFVNPITPRHVDFFYMSPPAPLVFLNAMVTRTYSCAEGRCGKDPLTIIIPAGRFAAATQAEANAAAVASADSDGNAYISTCFFQSAEFDQTYECSSIERGTPVHVHFDAGEFCAATQAAADEMAQAAADALAAEELVCIPRVPLAALSYRSASGNIVYSGYADARYMYVGNEAHHGSSIQSQIAWSSARTYGSNTAGDHSNRVFFSGKFYSSIQAGNINNTPNSSPSWWQECEISAFFLKQVIAGDGHTCGYINGAQMGCAPGQYLHNYRLFDVEAVAGTGGTISHSTGIETWDGRLKTWSNGPTAGGTCQQGTPGIDLNDPTSIYGAFTHQGVSPAPAAVSGFGLSVASKTVGTFGLFGTACNGSPSGGYGFVAGSGFSRSFSLPEIPMDYLTINGALTSNNSGAWPNAQTQNGLVDVEVTFTLTDGIPVHGYSLTVNYAATTGPVPPSEIYPFTTDGSGNAVIIVKLPFGVSGSQVSIASHVLA